jgi:hypothetical protein
LLKPFKKKRSEDIRGKEVITLTKKKNAQRRKFKFASHLLQRRLEKEAARLNRDFFLVLWKTFHTQRAL